MVSTWDLLGRDDTPHLRTVWVKDLTEADYRYSRLDDVGYAVPLQEMDGPHGPRANIISSFTGDTEPHTGRPIHLPVIDLDVPVKLVPSGTKGHSHLYIDVPMTDAQMLKILEALVDAGVVEPAYLRATEMRGMALVRRPETPKVCGDSEPF